MAGGKIFVDAEISVINSGTSKKMRRVGGESSGGNNVSEEHERTDIVWSPVIIDLCSMTFEILPYEEAIKVLARVETTRVASFGAQERLQKG